MTSTAIGDFRYCSSSLLGFTLSCPKPGEVTVHCRKTPRLVFRHRSLGLCQLVGCAIDAELLISPQEPLLATVKRRKLARFRHVTRHNSLSQTISQGTLRVGVGRRGRRRGRQRKRWMDQRQRLDIPARAGSVHDGVQQKKFMTGSLLSRPSCLRHDPIGQGTELT